MKRANGANIPSEFGRIPIPIMGASTMFPNWTIESWLDFVTVYLHLFLWYFPIPFPYLHAWHCRGRILDMSSYACYPMHRRDVIQALPEHHVVDVHSLVSAVQHYYRFDSALNDMMNHPTASVRGSMTPTL
jgi:hypothetical protein